MNYLSVRLTTLRGDATVPFPIFVKIGERYLLYVHANDVIDQARLLAIKQKGVKKFYIPSDQEPFYLEYLDNGLNDLKKGKLTSSEGLQVVQSSLIHASESAPKDLETESSYKKMEDRASQVVDYLLNEAGAAKESFASSNVDQSIHVHSSNVATFSVSLAQILGIKDAKKLKDLCLAAVVHDVARTTNDGKIDLNHPHASALKMAEKPYITREIISLVQNHEEYGDKAGYPDKKRISTLEDTQQILNLCNQFDQFVTFSKMAPVDAAKDYLLNKIGFFDLSMMQALVKAVQAANQKP